MLTLFPGLPQAKQSCILKSYFEKGPAPLLSTNERQNRTTHIKIQTPTKKKDKKTTTTNKQQQQQQQQHNNNQMHARSPLQISDL